MRVLDPRFPRCFILSFAQYILSPTHIHFGFCLTGVASMVTPNLIFKQLCITEVGTQVVNSKQDLSLFYELCLAPVDLNFVTSDLTCNSGYQRKQILAVIWQHIEGARDTEDLAYQCRIFSSFNSTCKNVKGTLYQALHLTDPGVQAARLT